MNALVYYSIKLNEVPIILQLTICNKNNTSLLTTLWVIALRYLHWGAGSEFDFLTAQ